MTRWHPNTGKPPREIAGVTISRVFVRLRDGREPAESWPVVTGRHGETTDWSLKGHPFDIAEWRPA